MKKNTTAINAFLGSETVLEGTFSFEGTVRMDGIFRGDIISGGILIIGSTAVMDCNIKTINIEINGEVHGTIIASQRVDLRSSAKVFGSIEAPAITMEDGAVFDGVCKMIIENNGADVKKVTSLHG